MGEFNFDKLDAEISKIKAEKEANAAAQASVVEQPDPNIPSSPEIQQVAPVQPQVAPTLAPQIAPPIDPNVQAAPQGEPVDQGFDIDKFLERDTSQQKPPQDELLVQQSFPTEQAPQLDINQAGADPSGFDAPEFSQEKRNNELLETVRKSMFRRGADEGISQSSADPSGFEAAPQATPAGVKEGLVAGTDEGNQALIELRKNFSDDDISAAISNKQGLRPRSILPEVAGSVAGSVATAAVLGRAIPGPIDDIGIVLASLRAGGQAAGTGAGAVAGRSIQAALDPDDETNKAELLKVFGAEAALELGSLGLGRMMQKAFRGGIRGAAPNAKELSELLTKKAQEAVPTLKRPVGLLPSQIAPDQPASSLLDSVVSKGLFSQRDDAQFRILQRMGAAKAGDTILDDFLPGVKSLNPEESFDVLSDVVRNNRRIDEKVAQKLYGRVDDIIAENTKISNISKQVPTNILDEAGKPITKTVTEEAILPPMVDISNLQKTAASDLSIIEGAIGADNSKLNLIKDVISKDSKLTFGATQESLTNLNEIMRESGDLFTKNRRLKSAATKLKKGLEAARDAGMDKLPGDAKKIAKQARTIWAQTSDKFDKPVLKQLFNGLEKNSENAVKFIGKQDVKNIKALKGVVGDETFNKLRKGWAEGVVKKAGTIDAGFSETGKGLLMGDSMLKTLTQNEDAVKLLLGDKQFKTMQDTARLISLIQKTETQGVAAFRMIQIGSALALVSAGAGGEALGGERGFSSGTGVALATAVLLGPKVLGALARKPSFAKALTEGINTQPGTKRAIRAGARLIKIVNGERKRQGSDADIAKRKARSELGREQDAARVESGMGQTGRSF